MEESFHVYVCVCFLQCVYTCTEVLYKEFHMYMYVHTYMHGGKVDGMT